jgi:glycosyltransferase involved in cell wall biosynthesis
MADVTILQVVPRLDAGGAETSTVEINEALARAGATTLVATEGGRMVSKITQAGGEIVELPVASKNPLTIFANAGRLTQLIECRKVDLIHARSRAPAWSAFLAARRTGRPFVTTYHGAHKQADFFKAMYNSVMARGDRVIANSCYTADLIATRRRAAQDRIRLIYRGIDDSIFDPATVSADVVERLRERWGVAPGVKIVLHPARLTRLKGQRFVIEAAANLNRQGALEGAVVIFVGGAAESKDSYRRELIELIARHGLGEKARLVGYCDDMRAAYRAAHVAVVPSVVPETFGRTGVEAQAMGCPVVLSNLGAMPETLIPAQDDENGFTGWLTPPRDVDALAERIRLALALTPRERAAIGARSRAHVTARFQLAQMQLATLAVYDELLDSNLADLFRRDDALMSGNGT